MTTSASEIKTIGIAESVENLLDYAIDRSAIQVILDSLHPEAQVNRVTVEYEIQLLKIITVGWGLSFFMAGHPEKEALTEAFWTRINAFSKDLSTAASTALDQPLDYFKVVKERTETYVSVLKRSDHTGDPVAVIGPKFAELCGDADNVHVVMAGNRTFSYALKGVREYLASILKIAN